MQIRLVVFILVMACVPSFLHADDSSRGTAIAAIKTPEEIVVAADSKEVTLSGSDLLDQACKIRESGQFF